MSKPRPISKLLSGTRGTLQQTLDHSRKLLQLEQGIKSLLPSDLAKNCQIANVKGDTLVMAVPGNVWATRLRYHLPQLLRQLKQHRRFKSIESIRIVVIPEMRQRKSKRTSITLSSRSAEVLDATASSIDDKALSAALRRLARHAKR